MVDSETDKKCQKRKVHQRSFIKKSSNNKFIGNFVRKLQKMVIKKVQKMVIAKYVKKCSLKSSLKKFKKNVH